MAKDVRYLYLGNRIKAAQAFQSGGSGKTSQTAVPGEVEPKLNVEALKKYTEASDYQDVKVTFEC